MMFHQCFYMRRYLLLLLIVFFVFVTIDEASAVRLGRRDDNQACRFINICLVFDQYPRIGDTEAYTVTERTERRFRIDAQGNFVDGYFIPIGFFLVDQNNQMIPNPETFSFTVSIVPRPGSAGATVSQDYIVVNRATVVTVEFRRRTNTAQLTDLFIIDDVIAEANEEIRLEITGFVGFQSGITIDVPNRTADIIIAGNNDNGIVRFRLCDSEDNEEECDERGLYGIDLTLTEGNTLSIEINLNRIQRIKDVQVRLSMSFENISMPLSNQDYTTSDSTLLRFPEGSGELTQTLEFEIIDDNIVEPNERVVLNISLVGDFDPGVDIQDETAVFTVVDNDQAVLGFDSATYEIDEDEGELEVVLRLNRTVAPNFASSLSELNLAVTLAFVSVTAGITGSTADLQVMTVRGMQGRVRENGAGENGADIITSPNSNNRLILTPFTLNAARTISFSFDDSGADINIRMRNLVEIDETFTINIISCSLRRNTSALQNPTFRPLFILARDQSDMSDMSDMPMSDSCVGSGQVEEVREPDNVSVYRSTTITILNDDETTLFFIERSLNETEDSGTIVQMINLTNPVAYEMTVQINAADDADMGTQDANLPSATAPNRNPGLPPVSTADYEFVQLNDNPILDDDDVPVDTVYLTFPSGTRNQTIRIGLRDDQLTETTEFFLITIGTLIFVNNTGIAIDNFQSALRALITTDPPVRFSITDTDTTTIEFSAESFIIMEGSSVDILVRFSGEVDEYVEVMVNLSIGDDSNVRTVNATATSEVDSEVDYTVVLEGETLSATDNEYQREILLTGTNQSQTLTISAEDEDGTPMNLPILEDDEVLLMVLSLENSERFRLRSVFPMDAISSRITLSTDLDSSTGTITDNDQTDVIVSFLQGGPTANILDRDSDERLRSRVNEGRVNEDGDLVPIRMVVTLSNPITRELIVEVSTTSEGSTIEPATPREDYELIERPQILSFEPNTLGPQSLEIDIENDEIVEGNEEFQLIMSVQVIDPFSLTSPLRRNIRVISRISSESAAETETLLETIETPSIIIPIIIDDDETALVNFCLTETRERGTEPGNSEFPDISDNCVSTRDGTYRVSEDTSRIEVWVFLADERLMGTGDSVTVTASVSDGIPSTPEVPRVTDGAALESVDFEVVGQDSTFRLSSERRQGILRLNIIEDNIRELDEHFTVQLETDNATFVNNRVMATVIIRDNDEVTVSLSVTDTLTPEVGTSTLMEMDRIAGQDPVSLNITVSVVASGPDDPIIALAPDVTIMVQLAVLDVTTIAPEDYEYREEDNPSSEADNPLTVMLSGIEGIIPTPTPSHSATITAIDDDLVEPYETFDIMLMPISDNVDVILSATEVDEVECSTTVPDNAVCTQVTISDDDRATVSLMVPTEVTEGDVIDMELEIEGDSLSAGVTFNINLAIQAGTATADDYRVGTAAGTEATCSANANEQTLTFTPGVRRQIVPICIIRDSLVEEPESFQVTLSITAEEENRLEDIQLIDGSEQSLISLEGVTSITVSISNSDQVSVGFDLLRYTVNENASGVEITIRLVGNLDEETRVNVRLNTEDASVITNEAAPPSCGYNMASQFSAIDERAPSLENDEADYIGHRVGTPSSAETTLLITLTAINRNVPIEITILDDQLVERPEVFCVRLTSDETGVNIDRPRTTVIITDDDQATITLTAMDRVSEGGIVTVTVAIVGSDPNEPVLADDVTVRVDLRIGNQGDTATAADDYTFDVPPTVLPTDTTTVPTIDPPPEGIIVLILTHSVSRREVPISTVNDVSIEEDESFDVEIELTSTEQNRLQDILGRVNIITVHSPTAPPSTVTFSTVVTVTITDGEDTGIVSFGSATANLENGCNLLPPPRPEEGEPPPPDYIVQEGGEQECRFSVPLSITPDLLSSPQIVLIDTRIADDTREIAEQDIDYRLENENETGVVELEFTPTLSTVTVTIAILSDTLLEEDESFELILLMSDAENGLRLEDTVTDNDPLGLIFASVTVVIRERDDNMIIWNIEEGSLTDSASDSVNNANIGNNGNNIINTRENTILRYRLSYTGLDLRPNQIFSIEIVLEAEETTPADFSQTLSQSLRTAAEQIDGIDITEESESGNSARVTFTIPVQDDPTIQVVIPTSLEFSLSIAADNQLERQESFSIIIRNAQVRVDNILDPTVMAMILGDGRIDMLISQDSSSLLEAVMRLTTPVLLRTSVPTMGTAVTRQVNQVLLNRITQLPEVSPQGFNINFASLVGGSEPQTGRPLPLEQRLRWNTWATGTFNNVNSEQDVAVEGTVINVWTGTDYLIDQNILIGVMVGYENSNLEVNEIEQSSVEGQGYGGGIYMGAKLIPGVIMDVSFAWMSISYDTEVFDTRLQAQDDEPIGNVSASFEAQRIMFAGNLTGTWHWNALRISPQVGVIWANEAQDAYQDSNNIDVDKQDFNFGRIVFGPELGIRMNMTANSWIEPFGAATGQYDFMTDIPQATILLEENGIDTEQDVRALDPDGQLELQARGGLIGGIGRSFTYRFEGAYDGLLAQSGYTAWSGSATLGYRWKDFLQLSFTNDYTGQDTWSSSAIVTYQWHDVLELSMSHTYGIAQAWSGSTDMRYQMRDDLAFRVSSQYNLKTLTPVNIYIDWIF